MPILPQKQKGMTLIAWVLVIAMGISAFIMVARMVPPFLESMSVQTALKSLVAEPNIKSMSAYKVKDLLNRKLYVNDVKNVKADDVEVSRDGDTLSFALKYEVRVHAIGNIDAVISFNKKVSTE